MGKVIKENEVNFSIKESIKRWTLNFTDIVSNSNKMYQLELIQNDKGKYYLYTNYGRLGGTMAKEYRECSSLTHAEQEAQKILKSKLKKGYSEIKLVQASIGSDVGKTKIEASVLNEDQAKKLGLKIEDKKTDSKLHNEVQKLVRTWFGATQEFIELNLDTKKCPLGQLSLEQISKGKDLLEEARKIVHSKNDISELNRLTNQYYSNIPHNFGYGKINADVLRFDLDSKIDAALDVLDVFKDAKNVENVLLKKNAIDDQYNSLNTDLIFVENNSDIWNWINDLFVNTNAKNHSGLGKIKMLNLFKVSKKNEETNFITNVEKIAKECGKKYISEAYTTSVKNRNDINKDLNNLYLSANVIPSWHGSKRINNIGITRDGLKIRPTNVVHTGSMFGDALYFSPFYCSTKSINYCDVNGSYWAKGNNKTAYLFLADVAFGKQKIVYNSHFFTKENIKPHHSVWARAGKGLHNDEMVIYNQVGANQQHCIKYIVEFKTQA